MTKQTVQSIHDWPHISLARHYLERLP